MCDWVEPLEDRIFLSVSLHEAFGVLRVNGGPGNDKISVLPQIFFINEPNGFRFDTRFMEVRVGHKVQTFLRSMIHRIEISGGGGNDRIELHPFPQPPDCDEAGAYFLFSAFEKPARVDGGDGNDTISGSSLNDTISAGSGNDLIFGNDGNDRISAATGADTIRGGFGNDYIQAGAGDDFIKAGSGRDTILAEAGDDVIYGNAGDDQIWGGTGHDAADQRDGKARSIEELLPSLPPVVCPL